MLDRRELVVRAAGFAVAGAVLDRVSAATVDPRVAELRRLVRGPVLARDSAAFEAARRLSTDVELVNALGGRALVEARAGDRARAMRTLGPVDSTAEGYAPTPAHTAVFLAHAHVALGQIDRALWWLERYQPLEDAHFQLHLRCDPPFDPLAEDQRFRRLLALPRPPRRQGC